MPRRRNADGRVTMRDIAAAVGTSVSTVSYALGGHATGARLAAATVEEIRAAALRLGWRANAAARQIRQGRFGAVAVVLRSDHQADHLPPTLLAGVMHHLEAAGLRLLLAHLPADAVRTQPTLLTELAADGLLIGSHGALPQAVAAMVTSLRLPVVWLNDRHDQADCVRPDEQGAGREAARLLRELGHRRLGYAHFAWSRASVADLAEAHFSIHDRPDGFRAANPDATALFRLDAGSVSGSLDAAVSAARSLLSAADRPTGVFCYSPADIEPLLIAARDLGLRVPQDLSLLCCGSSQGRCLGLAYDTLLIPDADQAEEGVRLLRDRLADPQRPPREIVLSHLACRGSTLAPPAA